MKQTAKKHLTGKKLTLRILLYVAVILICLVILYP